MSLPKFVTEGKKWGPKKLRDIFKEVEEAINLRCPRADCGITVTEDPDGLLIGADTSANSSSTQSGGGGSAAGTSADIYGALNGQGALYHLVQSAPPTVLP
jgi:hypothetical protein